MVVDLWQYYERNMGNRDGVRGWLLSWLSGQYRWLSHAKLIDRIPQSSKLSEDAEVPQDVGEALQFMQNVLAECRAPTPQLPLAIVWRGPLWDPSGYADESRTFIKGLSQGTRTLCVQDIHWTSAECELSPYDRALFNALSRTERPKYTATITNCIPTVASIVPATSLNILRTTFETDRLPEDWLEHLLRYDEVWVISKYNYDAFVRSWVPPEMLRIVPSCIDIDLFHPDGDTIPLPTPLEDRFVFLSVFDWGLRKGWDVLLKAYAEAFAPSDRVGLLLKITRNHGHSLEIVRNQANEALQVVGQNLEVRADIVFKDENMSAPQLAALYRSVNAFVLPTRGEGWGRPYMEAMASGLPTIGTNASGNIDFMNDQNSFLITANEIDVSLTASEEIPTYRGHRWFEPDVNELKSAMRKVVEHPEQSKTIGTGAAQEVRKKFDVSKGRQHVEEALVEAEKRFVVEKIGDAHPNQILVELQGELFAGHSFSKINEQLVLESTKSDEVALSVRRAMYNPPQEQGTASEAKIKAYMDRKFPRSADVVVRHSFPPNWEPPTTGKWVHIQPWEYGHLPVEWIEPLNTRVDEIWVPSHYVRQVYTRSGIASDKIQVIPWGVDTSIYHPEAIPLLLPTQKKFRFLFVGGAIPRKGFDRVLEAYLQEFSPVEDVALVVKDQGADSFYRYGNLRSEMALAMADYSQPDIVHIDQMLTEQQMPSLYTACHCLVAPYRGEGFGLHVLEAMACGLPPIVPHGGATDDFVNDENGFLLAASEIETHHDWDLTGPCLELEVEMPELRKLMRHAFESHMKYSVNRNHATVIAQAKFTWSSTWSLMKQRLLALVGSQEFRKSVSTPARISLNGDVDNHLPNITIGVEVRNNEQVLGECLSRLTLISDDIIVFDHSSKDRSAVIAAEYGAKVLSLSRKVVKSDMREMLREYGSEWTMLINATDLIDESWAIKLFDRFAMQDYSKSDHSSYLLLDVLQEKHGKLVRRRLRLERSHCTTQGH